VQGFLKIQRKGVLEELRHKIQAPEGNFGGQKRGEVVAHGKQFVRGQVDPMAGSWVHERHRGFL
jgi:hypothetical protein